MPENKQPGSDDRINDSTGLRQAFQQIDITDTIDFDKFQVPADLTTSASFDLRAMKLAEYGKLLQAIPIPILFVDKSDSIVFTNRAVGKISDNYPGIKGSSFSKLFLEPGESAPAKKVVEEVFAERKPRILEGIIEVGKSVRWVRAHLRSVRLKEKQLVLAILEDVTPEKSRLMLYEKYRKLFNLLPIGIVEFALTRPVSSMLPPARAVERILKAKAVDGNDEFARMHGYEKMTDLLGITLFELLPYGRETKGLYLSWTKGGFAISSAETRELSENAVVRYLENVLIGLVNDDQLVGFWLAKRDITERQGLREERLRAQKLESIGILAGGIAHDFNNFLTVILGSLNLAKIQAEPGQIMHRLLSDAEQATFRAKDLTTQLLTFSKAREPVKRVCSIRTLVEDSVSFALRGSNVICDFAFDDDLWPAEIDESLIYQVVNNIAINAAQAMPDGGWFRITLENVVVGSDTGLALTDGNYVRISFQDDGAGIQEEHLHRVFDPYFTTKLQGSGLGLATSYSIVKSHQGLITVDSIFKEGTTFHMYLPASSKQISHAESPGEELLHGSGRVLVMDDDEMVRRTAQRLLVQLGYEVKTARHGEEAIEMYRQAMIQGPPFDAVIMDLTVPGALGGKDAVKELREMDANCRVVVSSGYVTDPVMGEFEKYGFSGVVSKPYNAAELYRVLSSVIAPDKDRS